MVCGSEQIVIFVAPLPERLESADGYIRGNLVPFAGHSVDKRLSDRAHNRSAGVAEIAVRLALVVVIEACSDCFGILSFTVIVRTVCVFALAVIVEEIERAGNIILTCGVHVRVVVEVTLADPEIGCGVVIQLHKLPVVAPVTHQNDL